MNEYIDENLDLLIEKVEQEFKLWEMFLNNGIGLLSFTLGLASLGTNIPWVSAALSLFIVILIRIQGSNYFPPEIKKLRALSKSNKQAEFYLNGFEKNFFSNYIFIQKYPVFLIGFLFLFFIAISPIYSGFSESVSIFFGN